MTASTAHRLRVVIADDEDRARKTLRTLLADEHDVEVVAETAGPETVRTIRSLRPDLLFLDVQMPRLDGFGVLRSLEPDEIPVVIFVTAYEEHALAAFEVAAVDYLLKPFSDARFRTALDRARETLRKDRLGDLRTEVGRVLAALPADGGGGVESPRARRPEPMLFRDASRTHLIRPGEIDWVEAEDVYVRIHAGDRSLLIRETLSSLEKQLAPHGFYRIHRSALVNLDRIVELRHESHGDYLVLLDNGAQLTLTRTRKPGLEERLGRIIG